MSASMDGCAVYLRVSFDALPDKVRQIQVQVFGQLQVRGRQVHNFTELVSYAPSNV